MLQVKAKGWSLPCKRTIQVHEKRGGFRCSGGSMKNPKRWGLCDRQQPQRAGSLPSSRLLQERGSFDNGSNSGTE